MTEGKRLGSPPHSFADHEILRLRAQNDTLSMSQYSGDTRLASARSDIQLCEAALQERDLLLRGRQTLTLHGNDLFRRS